MKIPGLPRHACAAILMALAPWSALAQSDALTIADSLRACPVTPSYPPAALRNMATGRSLVRVTVNAEGGVTEAHLLRPSGVMSTNRLLDDAAVATARICRYPANTSGRPDATHRGVVAYNWRISGIGDDNPYSNGALESLQQNASRGDTSAAYWLYLRSDALPEAAAPSDALHWLSFAANHGMEKARQEVDRLHEVGEDAGLVDAAKSATP